MPNNMGPTRITAATAPSNNFILAKTGTTVAGGKQKGGKTAALTAAWYGTVPLRASTGPAQHPARDPPIQAEGSWNNQTNPTPNFKASGALTPTGAPLASHNMAFSMGAGFGHVMNKDPPKRPTQNTNAAQPYLKTHGAGLRSHDAVRPEASTYGTGNGSRVELRSFPTKNTRTRKV